MPNLILMSSRNWHKEIQLLINFFLGREICRAKNSNCCECVMNVYCEFFRVNN